MLLKKGVQVKVISGKDKGKTGEILEINRRHNKVKIKSIGWDQSTDIDSGLIKTINYAFSFNVYYWCSNIYPICSWSSLYDKLGA